MRDQLLRELRGERAAVLPLLAIFLFVFLLIAALAVDISAMEARGQTLQNTADAAALAGVAEWTESGNSTAATAVINDIIRQNGIGVSDGVTWLVSFPDPNEVVVDLTDPDPDVFLGGFVPGMRGGISRDATARLDICEIGCDEVIEIPKPFQAVTAIGSGDGYTPLAVGDRFYGINHDDDEIACIDRDTETACWTGVDSTPYADTESGSVSHAVVVGTRIFWTAQSPTALTLFCWETVTESTCAPKDIANLPRADSIGAHFLQRGGGTVEVNGRIFVFTDDHRTHCVVAASGATCPLYAGGKPNSLATALPPLDPADNQSGSNIDRVVNEQNNRIYHTLHVGGGSSGDRGVWLACWDPMSDQPCTSFSPYKFHDEAKRQKGRLFFHRTPGGTPDAICSTGYSVIECATLNGIVDDATEDSMLALELALPAAGAYDAGMGTHMWHEPSNRLFMTTPRIFSTDHCWDFSTASYCGSLYGFANGNDTQDYGFIYEGHCIFALGHNSIFWSFTSDLNPGCPGSTVTTRVDKCTCGGVETWGVVSFEFDIGPASPFTVLNVQVRDPGGNIVLPDDGSEWLEMAGDPSGVIDLSGVSTTFNYLEVSVYAEAINEDPWAGGTPPTVLIGKSQIPHLTE